MKTALVYSDDFLKYDYGPTHPFKMIRLKLTAELIASCGLFDDDSRLLSPEKAKEDEVLRLHTKDYLDFLRSADDGEEPDNAVMFGMGYGDNPIFPGVYEGSMLASGGTLMAARLVSTGEYDAIFNIAGGLHHAMKGRASGFCYLNDPAIAICDLIYSGKRVAYIDIDAHHGDGVQAAFYNSDKALTISFHESGRFLFPGTGYVEEIGSDAGQGCSVNVGFLPGTSDDVYEYAFDEIVPKLIANYRPDVIVAQLGADSLQNDPLSHLRLSNICFAGIVKKIKGFNVPLVALGGGGYDVTDVYRAWTLAYSVLCEKEPANELPDDFKKFAASKGYPSDLLRDEKRTVSQNDDCLKFAETQISYLKENLPLLQRSE